MQTRCNVAPAPLLSFQNFSEALHPYCRNFSTCHQQSPLFIRFFYKDELKNEIAELHYREIGASDSEEIGISRKLRLKNFCYEQVYFLYFPF